MSENYLTRKNYGTKYFKHEVFTIYGTLERRRRKCDFYHHSGSIFIRILAAATIDFGLAEVQLLIEDGSYSMAFIDFRVIPLLTLTR